VFSPYYRRALARDPATRPEDHCAINVCLYSPGARRWTMTERGARHVRRERSTFAVGPSCLQWTGDTLEITLDERNVPVPHAVRGRLRLYPHALNRFHAALDGPGRHRWGPIAPCAHIEVALQSPGLRWSGHAYLDSNEGDEPIERGFTRWDWLRTAAADGSTAVIYDVRPRDDVGGSSASRLVTQRFAPDGSASAFDAAPRRRLSPSAWWRIDRQVRAAAPARLVRTLEDTPFYARTLIELPMASGPAEPAVHETLDVSRLRSPLVQAMLPFRMPRRA
jgi:carotenoid 1,2-hydratase